MKTCVYCQAAATGHYTADFTAPELLAVIEQAKKIPRPEHDCIVMTEMLWQQLKWFGRLEAGMLLDEAQFGMLGRRSLYGLEVFTRVTDADAERLAADLRRQGRRPLLVIPPSLPALDGPVYSPSPLAESPEAWWKLNREAYGPKMLPPALQGAPQADTPVTVEGKPS